MDPYESPRDRAWHRAYCRWYDHRAAGHRIRTMLWGFVADLVVIALY